jgi:hypothetical protein
MLPNATWEIFAGAGSPIYFNSSTRNVFVTLTFQAQSTAQAGRTFSLPIANAPSGSAVQFNTSPGTVVVTVLPSQTITVTFFVEGNGGFLYGAPGGNGGDTSVSYELEEVLLGFNPT